MTMLWVLVPLVIAASAVAVAVLTRRVAETLSDLTVTRRGLQQTRLATVEVEDELVALRAALAQTPHR